MATRAREFMLVDSSCSRFSISALLGKLHRRADSRAGARLPAKRFGGKRVPNGPDPSVRAGECVAIVGRGGCGKSTLSRLLAGLDAPDASHIANIAIGLGAARKQPSAPSRGAGGRRAGGRHSQAPDRRRRAGLIRFPLTARI
jgi:hypothetical protein